QFRREETMNDFVQERFIHFLGRVFDPYIGSHITDFDLPQAFACERDVAVHVGLPRVAPQIPHDAECRLRTRWWLWGYGKQSRLHGPSIAQLQADLAETRTQEQREDNLDAAFDDRMAEILRGFLQIGVASRAKRLLAGGRKILREGHGVPSERGDADCQHDDVEDLANAEELHHRPNGDRARDDLEHLRSDQLVE